MKKILAALLALAVTLCVPALALTGSGYPSGEGASGTQNVLTARIGDQQLRLDFDGSAAYSGTSGGCIQACFFAFDETRAAYLECYLFLPETVAEGNVFETGGAASASGLTLYEVTETSSDCYSAGTPADAQRPAGSSYAIEITACTRSEDSLQISGTLNATLVLLDTAGQPTAETLDLTAAQFDFTLDLKQTAELPGGEDSALFGLVPTTPPDLTAV